MAWRSWFAVSWSIATAGPPSGAIHSGFRDCTLDSSDVGAEKPTARPRPAANDAAATISDESAWNSVGRGTMIPAADARSPEADHARPDPAARAGPHLPRRRGRPGLPVGVRPLGGDVPRGDLPG